jgi:hypothetical protein
LVCEYCLGFLFFLLVNKGLVTSRWSWLTNNGFSKDVALGVRHVIDGCTRPDMSVAGFAAPNGNGNMVVGATSVRYPFK